MVNGIWQDISSGRRGAWRGRTVRPGTGGGGGTLCPKASRAVGGMRAPSAAVQVPAMHHQAEELPLADWAPQCPPDRTFLRPAGPAGPAGRRTSPHCHHPAALPCPALPCYSRNRAGRCRWPRPCAAGGGAAPPEKLPPSTARVRMAQPLWSSTPVRRYLLRTHRAKFPTLATLGKK